MKFLNLFGFFMFGFLLINGLSFWIRQKDFDLIAYLFYPESYGQDWWIDLTEAPYWVSFVLGALYIFGPIYLYFKQKINAEL